MTGPLYWTEWRIIAAFQRWEAKHGEPPRARDWARGVPEYPAKSTVEKVFGSWNAGLVAAGFPPRRAQAPGRWKAWDKEMVAEAFLDFLLREGRWPTSTDCGVTRRSERTPGHAVGLPDWRTVARIFGSFNEGKRYAGWDGRDPRSKRLPAVVNGCSGCGAAYEAKTEGCGVCWERHRNRARRKDPIYAAKASAGRMARMARQRLREAA